MGNRNASKPVHRLLITSKIARWPFAKDIISDKAGTHVVSFRPYGLSDASGDQPARRKQLRPPEAADESRADNPVLPGYRKEKPHATRALRAPDQ